MVHICVHLIDNHNAGTRISIGYWKKIAYIYIYIMMLQFTYIRLELLYSIYEFSGNTYISTTKCCPFTPNFQHLEIYPTSTETKLVLCFVNDGPKKCDEKSKQNKTSSANCIWNV